MLDKLTKIDPKNLSPALRERLEALRERAAEVETERALVAGMREDPERVIAELEDEAERRALEAQVERRKLEADAAYRAACKKTGRHLVTVLPTCHGPVVLRCPPAKEIQAMAERAEAMREAGQPEDAEQSSRDWLVEQALVYPAGDVFLDIIGQHPGVATECGSAIGEMNSGRTVIAGKGV